MNQTRLIAALLAIVALLICVAAPLYVFLMGMENYEANFAGYKVWFNWATLLWFISAPFWMIPEFFQKQKEDEE